MHTPREQMAAALEEMKPLLEHVERFFKYQRPGHEFSPAREDVDACLDRAARALARHRAEPEANARLIASALKLLEALEKMMAYNLANQRRHQAGCPTRSQDLGCTCGGAEARAAIREAREE